MLRAFALSLCLTAVTGCGGCADLFGLLGLDAPFSHTIEGTLRLSFGSVDAECGGTGTREGEAGTITYAHGATADGNCGLGATWAGTLIDTTEAKAQVEDGMEEQGLDPATVKIVFTSVAFSTGAISFRDAVGNDLTPPSIPSYRGAIHIEGEQDLIVLAHEGEGDPTQAAVEVKDSQALVDALNAAWESGDPVPGTGDADAVVDMASAAAFSEADEPGLEMEYAVTVEATLGI